MISRAEALAHIAAIPQMTGTMSVALQNGVGRTLAKPVIAQHTQPPDRMSAMDGYAVRFSDCALGQSQILGFRWFSNQPEC